MIGTRRTFIKQAAAAAAVTTAGLLKTPVYGQSQAPASGRVVGANDRIRVAYIGTGYQGLRHIRIQKEGARENNIAPAAVCDLYRKHLQQAQQSSGLAPGDADEDYRRLLERKDIDAVVIATVDNWHAQATLDALDAGKHVLCEKPMSRYLEEALAVYDRVRKSGKTYAIASQGCLDPKWHKAAEWVRAGKLGPLVWGQGSYCRNNPKNSEWTFPIDADASQQNLDWERWLGRAPKIPFNAERFFNWHKYYAYNAGIVGNLLPHRLNPLLLATGNPEFPRRVVCTGTRKVSTDREIPDTTHVLAEFPSGLTLVLAGSTVNEQGLPEVLRGQKATLHFASSQNRVELKPESVFADELDGDEFQDPQPPERLELLHKDFFECIRTGRQPVANIELAVRAQTIISLAEMSERLGLALFFDEPSRTIRSGDGRVVPPLSYDTVIPKLG